MDKILQLYQIPGVGLKKVWDLINLGELSIDRFINSYSDTVLKNSLIKVNDIKNLCYKNGVKIICLKNPLFKDSPPILYVKGDESLLFYSKKLGVIGSRNPLDKYLKISEEYILHALDKGFITISGFANGCDKFAHRLTIKALKPTISVIPRGFNSDLDSEIAENGLVVSEYPPETPVYKYRCVRRNRLISGFSQGLLVIDAKEGSGSDYAVIDYIESRRDYAFINFQNENLSSKGVKISNCNEFDLYLENCIKYNNEKTGFNNTFKLSF